MKIQVLALALLPLACAGQESFLRGRVLQNTSKEPARETTVAVFRANTAVGSAVVTKTGEFTISRLPPGNYTVIVRQLGYRARTLTPVAVPTLNNAPLIIPFPEPCQFTYAKGQLPNCVGGHTDQLIPIIYGMLGPQLMARSQRGEVQLGGCEITGCDPHYYCPLPQREL